MRRDQYDGKYLRKVSRKGQARTPEKYIPSQFRQYLDDYLEHERGQDVPSKGAGPLFLSSKGGQGITRRHIQNILKRMANEANKHRGVARIELHPHVLRHTYAFMVRQKTGSDSETAAFLGHTSTRYVGRYARNSRAEREALLESLTITAQ